MAIALLTTYLTPYRVPLFRLLAERHVVEVLCYGGGERYVPSWFADLDHQLAVAPFPARRLEGAMEAVALGSRYDLVIAPFAGGAILPAAYAGAKRHGKPFLLWASVWAQPRSLTHAAALPVTRHIYRNADAVLAYGEHVRRFVAGIRGRDEDVFIVPQTVEPEVFARAVAAEEIARFRTAHGLAPDERLVLYVGRLVPEKGVGVLLDAWPRIGPRATLVLIGDGPLSGRARETPGARLLAPLARTELPAAYAASDLAVLASIPTPRFREPWGLVCNEAMHQARPMVASDAVGAVAGGLVVDEVNGLVAPAGDPGALAQAIMRLLTDEPLRLRLGAAGREGVRPYTYEAAAAGFDRALALARR
jgi:glycosyltransferase involved in cell wall biosynthesis